MCVCKSVRGCASLLFECVRLESHALAPLAIIACMCVCVCERESVCENMCACMCLVCV